MPSKDKQREQFLSKYSQPNSFSPSDLISKLQVNEIRIDLKSGFNTNVHHRQLDYKCECSKNELLHDSKNCWINASKWIDLAFSSISKTYRHDKETEAFNQLIGLCTTQYNIENEIESVKRDISRTVRNEEYFEPSQDGYNKFVEVLKGFILYDQNWGYVQGMNFIIAALVYHASSAVAFWLFTALIENYQLRINYIHGLEGYHIRSQEIAKLMEKNDPKMYSFLVISSVYLYRKNTT